MSIRLQGVPGQLSGLTLTDHSAQGVPTGCGSIRGCDPEWVRRNLPGHCHRAEREMAVVAPQAVRLVVLPTTDLNGDGVVDCLDLTAIKNAIGTLPPGRGRGFDVNGDGVVD